MYDVLSTAELGVLLNILYTATEKAYRLANLYGADWQHRFPVHAEVARLFLEAGNELTDRLKHTEQKTP